MDVPFVGVVVLFWTREDQSRTSPEQMRIRFLGPAGQELLAAPTQLVDLDTATRSRMLLNLNGLRIAGTGLHYFELSWRATDTDQWTEVGSIPLELSVQVDATVGSA